MAVTMNVLLVINLDSENCIFISINMILCLNERILYLLHISKIETNQGVLNGSVFEYYNKILKSFLQKMGAEF